MLVLRVPWLRAILNWRFAFLRRRHAPVSRARVIEFHVPATFRAPQIEWRPPQTRGKVLEFSARRARKSA